MKIHGWISCSLALFSIVAANHAQAATSSQSQWSTSNTWPLSRPSDDEDTQNISRKKAARRNSEPASPFAPGTHNLALEVGQSFLMGDLGDKYSDAIRYQAHYTYGVSDIFGFDSALGYASHSSGQYSMTSFMTGLRTNLSWYDKIVPYAIVGLGFYRPSVDVTPTNSVSSVLFGIHAGPGVSLLLTRDLFFGASLTFHDVFGTTMQTSSGPVALGGTYTDFLINAGITF
jgi:hypothetical protein